MMTSLTREHVLDLIREHLADELDMEPSAITEETRFKEDTRWSRSSRTPMT
jgi:hypothetical protein